jgi:diguanylate cyclase (GGDEF)-like protein
MQQPTHSLRTHLYLGLGSIGLGFVLATAGLRGIVERRLQSQVDAQVRSLKRHRDQQALLLVLMDEDVGLRSYVGTGNVSFLESYEKGSRVENVAIFNVLGDLETNDRAATQAQIDQLLTRLDDWHVKLAGPLIGSRIDGKLPDPREALVFEKDWFDRVTEALAFLGRDLDAQEEKRLHDLDRALSLARWIELVTYAGLLLSGFGLARWILGKVSGPLSDLVERASSRQGVPEPWTRRTIKEVDILGNTLYELEVQNREREQVLRTAYDEAQATKAYAEMVQRLTREEDLLPALDQALRRHLQPARQRVLLHPAQGPGLNPILPPMSPEEAASHPILGQANLCRAIRQGAPVCLGASDPLACICALGVPRQGSYLCIPAVASGRTLGLVNLQADDPDHWTPSRRRIAETLITTTTAALQATRSLHQAQERSLRDGLTGVYNRAFLEEFLPKIADQAKRKGFPFSLLMLDIDWFKRFNDEFGHEAGDHVLRAFAQCLQQHVRTGDVVARYGGEEFAVFLPHAGPDLAVALAERLRQEVQELTLPNPPFPPGIRITVSIGVASHSEDSPTLEALISLADQALYVAKEGGRNQVRSAGEAASSASRS